MPPRARFVAPLLVWSAFAACGRAQEAAGGAGDPSVWAQGFGAAPLLWAGLVLAGILTAAIILHLAYVLGERRGAPPKLVEALRHAMQASNYQEAWEQCGVWKTAYLSRILRPALERIGQGRERVEASLARRAARESRALTTLTWALVATGVAAPLLALFIGWAGLGALFRSDSPAGDARALTMAEGNFALIAAATFAIIVPALVFWITLRRRARAILASARSEAGDLVRDLAYEDLEGLRIGREFDAGTMLGEDSGAATTGRLRVSRELTTACPKCNAPINFSRKTCPHCGTAFEWS